MPLSPCPPPDAPEPDQTFGLKSMASNPIDVVFGFRKLCSHNTNLPPLVVLLMQYTFQIDEDIRLGPIPHTSIDPSMPVCNRIYFLDELNSTNWQSAGYT
jgi:hypothetical protein